MKGLKGISYAIISSATFGLIAFFSIPLMKAGMAASSILFYRFVFSTLLIGGICLVKKENMKISFKQLIDIIWLGALYAVTALLLIHSYYYIPSGIATTIHFMYPILVGILMIVFFKEKKTWTILIATILSVVGVGLLCWKEGASIQYTGIVIAALTILSYAGYIVGVNQSKVNQLSAEVLTFYILAAGLVMFFLYMMFDTGSMQPIPDIPSIIRLFCLALLCTVISDFTLILAIQYVGSTVTSILGSMEPLVAVLVGIFYFHESMDSYGAFGIALIILAVILVIKNKAEKEIETEKVMNH